MWAFESAPIFMYIHNIITTRERKMKMARDGISVMIDRIIKGSVSNVKEKMDIYIEGMKQCQITMQVERSGRQVLLHYKKKPQEPGVGYFYMDNVAISEPVIRNMLIAHYTENRRRIKDWADDVRFMAEQLEKQKVKS